MISSGCDVGQRAHPFSIAYAAVVGLGDGQDAATQLLEHFAVGTGTKLMVVMMLVMVAVTDCDDECVVAVINGIELPQRLGANCLVVVNTVTAMELFLHQQPRYRGRQLQHAVTAVVQ